MPMEEVGCRPPAHHHPSYNITTKPGLDKAKRDARLLRTNYSFLSINTSLIPTYSSNTFFLSSSLHQHQHPHSELQTPPIHFHHHPPPRAPPKAPSNTRALLLLPISKKKPKHSSQWSTVPTSPPPFPLPPRPPSPPPTSPTTTLASRPSSPPERASRFSSMELLSSAGRIPQGVRSSG